MTAAMTVLFRSSIGNIYTSDAIVASIAGQFLIYSAGWQLFDAISTPIQGILRGLKDTRVSFVLMVIAYWGGCFPMSLFLDHVVGLGADSYWLGLVFGVGCSALLMVLRLVYVERVMDGEALPSFAFFMHREITNPATVHAVVASNVKQAKELLVSWERAEEKLASLVQDIKEAEVDIFTENRRVLPICRSLLTDLHLCILGHATRAYIP